MYCPFCNTILSKEAIFCFNCERLISRGKGESEELEHAPAFAPVSSPPGPYDTRPTTYYELLSSEEGTQNPYASMGPYVPTSPHTPPAPPDQRNFFSGFLKWVFIVIFVFGAIDGLLLLKQGALSPPALQSIKPALSAPKSTKPSKPKPKCSRVVENVGVTHIYTTGLVQAITISDTGYWSNCGYSNFQANPSVAVHCSSCTWQVTDGFYNNKTGVALYKQNEACGWANITATLGKMKQVFYYRVYILPNGATANHI